MTSELVPPGMMSVSDTLDDMEYGNIMEPPSSPCHVLQMVEQALILTHKIILDSIIKFALEEIASKNPPQHTALLTKKSLEKVDHISTTPANLPSLEIPAMMSRTDSSSSFDEYYSKKKLALSPLKPTNAFSIDAERMEFRQLMASYHEASNRMSGLGRRLESITVTAVNQKEKIETLEDIISDQKQQIQTLSLDSVEQKTKQASIEFERDSALTLLRQFQNSTSNSERFNSVVPITSLTVELKRRDQRIKTVEAQLAVRTIESANMAFALEQQKTRLMDLQQSMDDTYDNTMSTDALNQDLVDKLNAKNIELNKALESVQLLSGECHESQEQLTLIQAREAASTEKFMDLQHAKVMQEAQSNLVHAEFKRDYEAQIQRIKEINFELREESNVLNEQVQGKAVISQHQLQVSPYTSPLKNNTASSRNSPGRSPHVAIDGKIAAGLVQWKTFWSKEVTEKEDSTLDSIADDLITSLCTKVDLLETELLAKPKPKETKMERQPSIFDFLFRRVATIEDIDIDIEVPNESPSKGNSSDDTSVHLTFPSRSNSSGESEVNFNVYNDPELSDASVEVTPPKGLHVRRGMFQGGEPGTAPNNHHDSSTIGTTSTDNAKPKLERAVSSASLTPNTTNTPTTVADVTNPMVNHPIATSVSLPMVKANASSEPPIGVNRTHFVAWKLSQNKTENTVDAENPEAYEV